MLKTYIGNGQLYKHLQKIMMMFFAGSFLMILPDLFMYDGFLFKHIGINPHTILWITFVLFLGARVLLGISHGKRFFAGYFFIVVPIFLVTAVVMQIAEMMFFTNIIYGYTHILPKTFADIALFLTLFSIVFFEKSAVQRWWKQTIFVLGIISFALYVFVKWRIGFVFYHLDQEDRLLEYATFFLYLVSGLVSLVSVFLVNKLKILKQVKVVWIVLLGISALGLFLVAGEEISWGQRIFNLRVSEETLAKNEQLEFNLHNTTLIIKFVYKAYLLLGIYGVSSWILRHIKLAIKKINLAEYLHPVLSRWYLIPYFTTIIGYALWRHFSTDGSFDIWEETAEIFLAIGIFLIFLISHLEIRKMVSKASGQTARSTKIIVF